MNEDAKFALGMAIVFGLLLGLFVWSEVEYKPDAYGCDMNANRVVYGQCHAKAEYNDEVCRDVTTLAATTAGSPNSATCPNKRHKMRVETRTVSGDEIGVSVFCECQKESK